MKKALIAVTALVLAGCAPYEEYETARPVVVTQRPVVQPVVQPVLQPVLVEKAVPVQTYRQTQVMTLQTNCPCAGPQPCTCSLPDPCREVQRPRIKEVVTPQPRRNCPLDGQMINCGCGNQKTFEQLQVRNAIGNDYYVADTVVSREVIPAMPEAYVLASNRVVSRFFKDASSVYGQRPNMRLYVKPAMGLSADLPGGLDKGSENFKKQVASSYTFEIVDNPSSADYYLETTADWFDTPSKSVPAIQYKSVLYDNNNNKVKEWVEIIKKADNSQSWL